ncbi:unnamed protein product [Amoebophrya sp. A120]|nr:unnamed protein product [Amoebophrya sp. A120]|eukprot:GSA120T00024324001.1
MGHWTVAAQAASHRRSLKSSLAETAARKLSIVASSTGNKKSSITSGSSNTFAATRSPLADHPQSLSHHSTTSLINMVAPEDALQTSCTILPGFFGVFVQVVLGVCCFSTLIVKWRFEKPFPRPAVIFFRDSSKQFVGGAYMHALNMLAAYIFATKKSNGDECDWYWVNVVIDCTLGTFLNCIYLRITEKLFSYSSGVYEDSSYAEIGNAENTSAAGTTAMEQETKSILTRIKLFFKALTPAYRFQIGAWILVLTCMKLTMILIFFQFGEYLVKYASELIDGLFGPTSSTNKLKLVFVMIVTPVVMNIFQFWVSDSFLKASNSFSISGGSIDSRPLQETQ